MKKKAVEKPDLSKFRHDTKNILTVVRLNLTMLNKNPGGKDVYIKKIEDSIDRLLENLKGL